MMNRAKFSTNALMFASSAALACGLSLHADVIEITQDGMNFIPNEVDAAPGDTLHFIWGDGGHTVTSGFDCVAGPIDGFSFDEPLDDINTLVVIEIPLTFTGDLGYLCDIYTHCEDGGMHGVVHVAHACVTPESPSAYTTEWRMNGMGGLFGGDLAADLGPSTITPTGMVVDVDYWLSNTDIELLPSGALLPGLPCSAAECAGDFNGDGQVDAADLGSLLAAWGTAAGDLNSDGNTDAADLGMLLALWGSCDSTGPTGVLVMNGGASPHTGLATLLNVPANDGFTTDIGEFTLIMDLYIPSGEAGNYVGMWNGNAHNENDADTFLYKPTNNFWSAGAGVVGDADSWAFDGWFRFVQRVDYSENTADIYVNGVHVTNTVAPDWWYNSLSGNPVWMLADNNGETQLMYCANMAIVDAYMDEADISALGGPMAAGIFSGNPFPASGASYDSSCDCSQRTAWVSNQFGESYMGDGTTCEDTDCPIVPGDVCDTAVEIVQTITVFDTTDATTSGWTDIGACDSMGGMSKDLFFFFVSQETGTATVTTCDSDSFDTSLSAFSSCNTGPDVQIACSGDASGQSGCQDFYSSMDFAVEAGVTYIVCVGGWNDSTYGLGTLTISGAGLPDGPPGASFNTNCDCTNRTEADSIAAGEFFMGEGTTCADSECPVPDNNMCDGAIMITESMTAFDSSYASSSGFPYDIGSCTAWPGDMDMDVWYHFTPTEDGVARVSTCDSGSYDTTLAVFEGGSCDVLMQLGCNGDGEGDSGCQNFYSVVEIPVLAGGKYYVSVSNYNAGVGGPGTITITGVGIDDTP